MGHPGVIWILIYCIGFVLFFEMDFWPQIHEKHIENIFSMISEGVGSIQEWGLVQPMRYVLR